MNPFEDIHTKSRRWKLSDDGIEIAYDADFLVRAEDDGYLEELKGKV